MALNPSELHERRLFLAQQHAAMTSGQKPPASVVVPAQKVNTMPVLLRGQDHLMALGLHRKSVRARPVLTDYQPQHTWTPVVFPYKAAQRLSKLVRPVSAAWWDVLTSISTTSLAGGRLLGNQGRNLARIIERLRGMCFLRVDDLGRPVQVREQVTVVVEHFARSCGMSLSTFYAALRHPLAHVFLRTQKVQTEEEGSRRNVGTLFTVALYEPEMPADLEAEFYAESVEEGGVFVVLGYNFENDRTKERPLTTQKQGGVPKTVDNFPGRSPASAMQTLTAVMDSAPLGTKKADALGLNSAEVEGCLDRLRLENPAIYDQAVAIALEHDTETALQNGKEAYSVAVIGYYKAIIHLGMKPVYESIKKITRWRGQGQNITNPGALLTSLLNQKTRALTGYNIRDLSTTKGQVNA